MFDSTGQDGWISAEEDFEAGGFAASR